MKHIYTLTVLFALISSFAISQIFEPEGLNIPGTWNSFTNPPASNSVFGSANQVSGGKVTKITSGTARWKTTINVQSSGGDIVGGSYTFLFTSGPSGSPYNNKWAGTVVTLNSLQSYSFNTGADNSITVSNGKYYTVVWKDNGYANTHAIFMETSAQPVTIDNVAQSPNGSSIGSGVDATITITTSATPSAEEKIYVRYSTDSWTTSSVVEANFTGTTGTATIPAQIAGKTVIYYVFSTTIASPSADHDLVTINFNNNSGSNFQYTTTTYTTAQNGNWSDGSTWVGGNVPPNNNSTSIVIAHDVTLNADITLNSLVVNTDASLSDNGVVSTINFSSNAVVTNNGTLNLAVGTPSLTFAGTGTINGSNDIDFAYVLLYGGVDFGEHSTINYGLDLYTGGYVNINPPTYLSDSYLGYASGGIYNRGPEWKGTSGPGYPDWVYIYGGTTVNLKNVSDPNPECGYLTIENGSLSMGDMTGTLTAHNDLQIDASGTLTLSTSAGGDLVVEKNWTNSGTFVSNGRRVTFSGTAFKQINNTGSGNFAYVSVDNESDIRLASGGMIIDNELKFVNGNFRINAPLTISSGGTILDYSSSKYIVIGSSMTLTQTVPGTNTDVVYPIGMNPDDYSPVTLNNNGGTADLFSVTMNGENEFVIDGNGVVTKQWIINEAVDGGSNVFLTLQWKTADQGASFVQNGASIGKYNGTGTSWTLYPSTVISSVEPFQSKTTTAFTGTGVFQSSKFKIGNSAALPVELTSFSAQPMQKLIRLQWNTATELNNAGFEIERKQYSEWSKIGFVEGHGTTNSSQEYSYTDKGLTPGKYMYRLRQIDRDGKFEYSPEIEAYVSLAESDFSLSPNYPNPFNPTTNISFAVKERQFVSLKIFNLVGQEVATLVNGVIEPNVLQTVQFNGKDLSSGVYFYSLTTKDRHEIRKLMLMK